jgi:CheY-like chemotaxis protein
MPQFAHSIKTHPSLHDTKTIVLGAESAGSKSTDVDAWVAKPLLPSHLFKKMFGLLSEAAPNGTATLALAQALNDSKHKWRKDVRIMQIGESVLNHNVLSRQLSVLGYHEIVVEDARRGLELASNGGCDIVLIDCERVGIDAYRAAEKIIESEDSHIRPVLIGLTGQSADQDRNRCLESGMDECLSKPIKLSGLAVALDQWTANA